MPDSTLTPIPRRAALLQLGALAAVTALPTTSAVASPPEPQQEEDFTRLLRLTSVPSLSYARIDGDRIETRSIGLERAGDTRPATPDSVYAAASLTKTVFAYVFLGLVEEGVVSLDTPVKDYLPLPNPDDARATAITARHLLGHSGGWRNWRNTMAQPLTSDFVPGSRWSYSGEGYFFLQRILEKLTGRSVSQLARERVFEPLGMKRSSFAALEELEPLQVAGHSGRGDVSASFGRPALLELRRTTTARGVSLETAKVEDSEAALKAAEPALPVLPNFLNPNAAASMHTTANDFALFLRHLVTARRKGGKPAAIVNHMMSPQVRCNEAVQWGLGVGLEDVGNTRYAWQWGDNSGFKHIYLADPQNEKAIVVFTNGDRGARVYERVVRSLTGVDHPAFLWL